MLAAERRRRCSSTVERVRRGLGRAPSVIKLRGASDGDEDIAEKTELTRRQVADVFEALESVIERHVQKWAVGACTIPGLMKIKVVKKPAQRARKNVPNPFRPGETMDVTAKPASTSVKVLPLKKLKDMA